MSDRQVIGSRIREEREAAGYTQAELGAKVGVDSTVLSRIESGQRGLDSIVLRRLAATLDVPMDRFFSDKAVVMARGEGEQVQAMIRWARHMKSDIEFVSRELARLDA